MNSEKVFQIALLISVGVHAAILAQNANWSFFRSSKDELKNNNLEVRYLKKTEQDKPLQETPKIKREEFLRLPPKITLKESQLLPQLNKEDFFKKSAPALSSAITLSKPFLAHLDVIAIKKKITLAPAKSDKFESPTYVAHAQIVREKIKRSLYQNYNRMDTGQVVLSFILSNDGFLKAVRVSDEKSTAGAFLKEIALRSIKDAAPFPAFPKELDYEQLTFNVVISFEVE